MNKDIRKEWLDLMLKIADPVLLSLSEGKLKEKLPMDFHTERKEYAHLEALGRTLQGMAPWLELSEVPEGEAALQEKYRAYARKAIVNGTNPESPDYMNFTEGYGQSLVDAAFLAHAIVRAPRELYEKLAASEKENLAKALKSTRKFAPFESNWLFFSGMIETALYIMGESYEMAPIEHAVDSFEKWYVGDGTYGDGVRFHWDYYNSFVIHPMYVDILKVMRKEKPDYQELYEKVLLRAGRYAMIQEQMINADGSYPVLGRSTTYRFGAFHALANACLEQYLPDTLPYAQARSALNAVIEKVVSYPDMFDENGWLTPGVCGCQPDMAEGYICVGSLYLCLAVFVPLGLCVEHDFWAGEELDWTAKKLWSGQNMPCDHAVD